MNEMTCPAVVLCCQMVEKIMDKTFTAYSKFSIIQRKGMKLTGDTTAEQETVGGV
jgi:hypothetical protein